LTGQDVTSPGVTGAILGGVLAASALEPRWVAVIRLRRRVPFVINRLRILQRLRDALCPRRPPGFLGDEILADLELDVGQPVRFGVVGDGVVSQLHEIRFVLRNQQLLIPAQHFQYHACEPAVMLVKHRSMHLPARAFEDIGHCMLSDEERWTLCCLPCAQQCAQSGVVGLENFQTTSGDLIIAQADVTGNRERLGHRRDRGLGARSPIAIDDEARVFLGDEGSIEGGGHPHCDRQSSEVPCRVPLELRSRQSEAAEAPRHAPAGMVDGDYERRTSIRSIFDDRWWFVRLE